MIERILDVLKIKNLSPAQFADMIGVQRSSISHLISGRNKPSLEFLQKLLKTFPEINSDWILFGKGEMIVSGTVKEPVQGFPEEIPSDEAIQTEKHNPPGKEETGNVLKKKWIDPEGKKIEKIVCFYKDNTFREYLPE